MDIRKSSIVRTTKETDINLTLNIDGYGNAVKGYCFPFKIVFLLFVIFFLFLIAL